MFAIKCRETCEVDWPNEIVMSPQHAVQSCATLKYPNVHKLLVGPIF